MRLGDLMTPVPAVKFAVKGLGTELSVPSNALSVATDGNGKVVGTISGSGLQVALQSREDTPLMELLDNPEVAERLVAGAPGVVVVKDGEPRGFVSARQIFDAVSDGFARDPNLMGDHDLGGGFMLPPLVVLCSACGARNELLQLNVGVTPCRNGHVLGVSGYEQ